MRLGFVSGRMCSCDGEDVWVDAGVGRLVDALTARAQTLSIALSLSPVRRASHDHCLRIPRRALVALPYMPSFERAMRHGCACRAAIERVEARSDVVIMQLPFAPPWALVPPQRPRVYHACADVTEVLRANRYQRGLRRRAAFAAATFMHASQRALVRGENARLLANGEALYRKLGPASGDAVVSTTLRGVDVDSVQRTRPKDAPLRILFVGYLRPEKGLDVLLDAYDRILRVEATCELHIVGAQDLSEGGAARELNDAVGRLGERGRIVCHGQVRFGHELFAHFANADVLCLPSRSEGTPRVLLEARAFRCPVVASRVGGVPTSVKDGVDGLLVEPDRPDELADAVIRIRRDEVLRARLVENGLARVRDATVERFADALIRQVHEILGTAP